MSDEAEDQWRNWQQALGPIEEADRLQGPDDTITYGSDDSQEGFADEDVDGLLRYHEVDGDQDDLDEDDNDNEEAPRRERPI